MQCPWGLRGRNIVELSDVYICISPRKEAEWEEGPAQRRAYATKRAQLSAAETSRQLAGTSSGQKGGYGWSFLTWGSSILLNKLQFRMKRTHVCFKASLMRLCTLASSQQHKNQRRLDYVTITEIITLNHSI